jgi:hypothetical protein
VGSIHHASLFWSMRFPKLTSICFWGTSERDVFQTESIIEWLLLHIWSFDLKCLGFTRRVGAPTELSFDKRPYAEKNRPPRDRDFIVTSLTGSPSFFAEFTTSYACVKHFKRLRTVRLSPNATSVSSPKRMIKEFTSNFKRLVDGDTQKIAFPALHKFSMDLHHFGIRWHAHPTVKKDCLNLVNLVGLLCGPSLRRWSTFLPPFSISAEELGEAFGKFPRLKEIYLPLQMMGGTDGMEQYTSKLVKKCPRLRRIFIVRKKDIEPSVFLILEIGKNNDGLQIHRKSIS